MRRFGRSNRSRERQRWDRELKAWLQKHLPEQCESCGTSYGLTVMHATKRRFIRTREDYFRAALVCWPEHQSFDEGIGADVHEKMAAFVDGLIEKRNGIH